MIIFMLGTEKDGKNTISRPNISVNSNMPDS